MKCKFREMTLGFSIYLIVHQTQKITTPHSMGSMRLQRSNIEVLYFGLFFKNEVPHSKNHEN
jgi:hypothetical protein